MAPLSPIIDGTVSTTVQNIIDASAKDAQSIFFSSGGNGSLLIDYTNRVCQHMQRYARWDFEFSTLKRFITKVGQSDYWIGATGSNPAGTVDTALNLTDVTHIREGTVFDRTNRIELVRSDDIPASWIYTLPDESPQRGVPRLWRQDSATPYVFSLYPAPDGSDFSGYQPVPQSPSCTAVSGGALAARTYFVQVTLTDSNGGESAASNLETRVFIPASNLLQVASPTIVVPGSSDGVQYTGYRVYASTTTGTELYQSNSTTLGTAWTEPVGGLVTGTASVPTASTIEPLYGSIIEFRYYLLRTALTLVSQTIPVPDTYKDIVIAGVNEYLFNWASQTREEYFQLMEYWKDRYQAGLMEMRRDFNLFHAKHRFAGPDPSSQTLPTVRGRYSNYYNS